MPQLVETWLSWEASSRKPMGRGQGAGGAGAQEGERAGSSSGVQLHCMRCWARSCSPASTTAVHRRRGCLSSSMPQALHRMQSTWLFELKHSCLKHSAVQALHVLTHVHALNNGTQPRHRSANACGWVGSCG